MARVTQKYNHIKRIIGRQPANIKAVYPGMFCTFKYTKQKTNDPRPIVFVIWNDYQNNIMHGINLNYLTDLQIRKIFQELQERGGNTLSESLPITTEDQEEEEEYDGDRKPNKKLLKKPYTRIKLPTYQEEDDSGATISKSVAETQMRRLYEKVIKRYVDRFQVYRSYSYKLIQVPQVIYYDTEGMQK